jgi:hypothetical protein
MNDTQKTIQEEKERFLLKIIEWAQKQNKKVELLTFNEILKAARCKL